MIKEPSGESTMSIARQTILASRPAATVLALTLVAALTTPFVLLPRAHAAPTSPATLPCAEINNNGCTELSATPPQDTQAVPPNILLMLDDSGSMAWDFMPDWGYLSNTSLWGARNAGVNGVYYNPTTVYTPPPKADGTSYPNSPGLSSAYKDGFTDTSTTNVRNYTGDSIVDQGHQFRYWESLPTTNVTDYGAAVQLCPSGYVASGLQCVRATVVPSTTYKCNAGDTGPTKDPSGTPNMCRHRVFTESGKVDTWYPATPVYGCPSGSTYDSSDGMCHYPPKDPTWQCPSGGTATRQADGTYECLTRQSVQVFTYVVGAPIAANAHYVAAGTDCDILLNATQKANCVNESDITGTAAPAKDAAGDPLSAGQNVANWFSYYRTRLLMSKSGLMLAFSNLNPKYRFGFASINGNGKSNILGPEYPASASSSSVPYVTFDDSYSSGGDSSNRLAVVQPFGDGSDSTSQKAKFWNWIANESANNGTPLRKALQAVGQYYQTDQPWTTMSSDPGYTAGSTTKFACRASYTILTTDGFWNGANPSGIGYAAGVDGPDNSPVPSADIKQYTAVDPFKGGGVGGSVPSLADVATYYWENDLQTGIDWPNEVATSVADPASWQHMTTFTIGLGFTPQGISGTFTHPDTPVLDIEAWAQGGAAITGFSWPTPASNSIYNIADLAHAAINGHGEFFNVTKPTDLADALNKAFSDIASRTDLSPSAAVNASVLSLGALSFTTGYETKAWSGTFQAVTLNADGSTGDVEWDAGANLNTAFHAATYTNRKVWTSAYTASGSPAFSAFQFTATNAANLDSTETNGLGGNTDCATTPTSDTICNRINYLLGDPTYEGTLYRARTSGILGAIIRSQPVYVAAASSDYYAWPSGSPEANAAAGSDGHDDKSYDAFVADHADRAGTVYVGANDGMLHAFDAPVPADCASACNYNPDGTAGNERWAYVPRAVYANLGNLTNVDFHFLQTVNETPVTRDVFFSEGTRTPDKVWHTILAGGVGLGGRGVYALDITDPTSFSSSNVLWEFDSDSSVAGCTSVVGSSVSGSCSASDLGYTVSQPNIGRINYGNKWVVLMPNGYFPDCTTPDFPTATLAACQTMAGQAPRVDPSDPSSAPYSALFVLDAETGSVIAELKTPAIDGVTSFGLSTPVMGDYLGNQIDTVAFAGDVQGNLWRFDFAGDPSTWKVTLVYQAPVQGAQPITTMPRLFPDPTTNRFMVVFGTGKFLGIGDNGDDTAQAIYGVRDVAGKTWQQSDLTQQYLHEETPAGGPFAGISLRCITGSAGDSSCTSSPSPINTVPASSGGWYINLQTTTSDGTVNDAGERVVATPAAIFSSNTVVVGTLITGAQNTDACNPSTQGSILALNVLSGGTAGVSSLGGGAIAGARITNARTSGSLPIVSQVGGARGIPVGSNVSGGGNGPSLDILMYRRRSWNEINQNQ